MHICEDYNLKSLLPSGISPGFQYSVVFFDTERAGGASNCWPISIVARTGWDDEMEGGPGAFEVNILPEGNID